MKREELEKKTNGIYLSGSKSSWSMPYPQRPPPMSAIWERLENNERSGSSGGAVLGVTITTMTLYKNSPKGRKACHQHRARIVCEQTLGPWCAEIWDWGLRCAWEKGRS